MRERGSDATPQRGGEPGPYAPDHIAAREDPADERFPTDPKRLAEGWERRFVIEGARVADYVRLYESLGYEVLTEPAQAEEATDDCKDCRVIALLAFRVIYTRPRDA